MMNLRIERTLEKSTFSEIVVVVASIIASFLISAVLLWIVGFAPGDVFWTIFHEAFFTVWGLKDSAEKAVPLIVIGLGLTIAFRMKIWNIGGEGQFYVGAIAATGISLFLLPQQTKWVLLPALLIAGFIAGALLGGFCGWLKAYLGVNEIVSTLMLNYVAILLTDYLVYHPWRDPEAQGFAVTAMFPEGAQFPMLLGRDLHAGVLFCLILPFIVAYFQQKTSTGFEMKVIGDNQNSARYAGIDVKWNITLAMFLSGGLGGLAGAIQMVGLEKQLMHGISPGYGYTAIIVAFMARQNPYAVVIVGYLLGGLFIGGEQAQVFEGVPLSLVQVIQAVIFFCLLAGEVLNNYRIRFASSPTQAPEAAASS